MEKSLYQQYVDKWFMPLIMKIVATINGTENPLYYWHKRMLSRRYSPTMKWGSLGSRGRAVAADIVSLNSSLPLKKRDRMESAEGILPKIGMKLYLNEEDLTELDMLEDQNQIRGGMTNQILRMLFADTRKCIVGIDEQLEGMWLQALSSGVTAIPQLDAEGNNTGTAIRLDFKVPDENRFGVTAKWSGDTASPIDDLRNVIRRARSNGHIIAGLKMNQPTFDAFRKHAQVKELFAFSQGFAGQNTPIPTFDQVNSTLRANSLPPIELIERTITYEKSGVETTVDPWTPNTVVFVTRDNLGSLVWGRLAEMNHRAKQVTYAVADEFKLISKYHKIDPLREYTSSQAIVAPVLDAPEELYLMNTEEATASLDAQTEGDAVYTYQGTDYTKQSVVDGLNATEEVPVSDVTQADSTLAKKIDRLSEDGVKTFESHLVTAGV